MQRTQLPAVRSETGRPKEDDKAGKKLAYRDYIDRIEIERAFSLAKRRYGFGWIMTKLDETTRSSIALSVIAMNVAKIHATFFRFSRFFSVARKIQEYIFGYFWDLRSVTIMKLSLYIRPLLRPIYEQNKHYEFQMHVEHTLTTYSSGGIDEITFDAITLKFYAYYLFI